MNYYKLIRQGKKDIYFNCPNVNVTNIILAVALLGFDKCRDLLLDKGEHIIDDQCVSRIKEFKEALKTIKELREIEKDEYLKNIEADGMDDDYWKGDLPENWESVIENYYPDYYQSDEIARWNDLSKYIEGELDSSAMLWAVEDFCMNCEPVSYSDYLDRKLYLEALNNKNNN